MATTTNYGWTTPDNTDLVKDGALAIRTLGSAIDTSMNTALGTKKAGLVLLNTTSFSAVSSQSINDVFSATYQNYRIVIQSVNASANAFRWRLRVSGSDDSNNVYVSAYSYEQIGGAGTGRVSDGATTSWTISQSVNQTASNAVIDIFRPFETTPTYATFMNTNRDTVDYIYMGGLIMTNSTSFTGFSIFPANGVANATGTVRVYGYNQ